MKRGFGILALYLFVLLAMPLIASETQVCNLNAVMINQDPYPAVPGEYVKLVFQLEGVDSSNCNGARFEIVPSYPFSLQPGVDATQTLSGNTWISGYKKDWIIGYKLLVDQNALDNDYTIKVRYSPGNWQSGSFLEKEFDIEISDVTVDFEAFVKDYNPSNRELTLEVLNIGKSNVEALTITIPKQENVEIKGANRIVVGDLDPNEYTTADFEAILKEETEIDIIITYTDEIGERREISKTIQFDPVYFNGLLRDQSTQPVWLYILIVLAIGGYVWHRIRKHKKKKAKEHHALLHGKK